MKLQVPGTAPSASYLSASEIEIGMGIHNESGHRRLSPIPPLSELLPQLIDLLTSTSDPERSFVPFKNNDGVVLLVNNLGSVSELELSGIVTEARKAIEARGFKVLRVLSGAFMVGLSSERIAGRAHTVPIDQPQYARILAFSPSFTSSARAEFSKPIATSFSFG